MKKLILTAFVALMAQASALAYDFIENGFAFNILRDGTLSLTNKVKEFSTNNEMDQALTYKGDVTVPASVTHAGKKYKVSNIGRYAFYDCRSITSVKISEGISSVDYDAFYYCSMTSLTIPASVTKLVPGCLHQCPKLATITVSPQNASYSSQGNCIYNKAMTQLFFVSPVLRLYKFPTSVRSVADFAFNGSNVRKLTIPTTLTHIGGLAFYSTNIKEIVGKRPLQKLAGSQDYMPGCPLPVWALSPAALKTVNTKAGCKALAGRKDLWRPNTCRHNDSDSQIILSSDSKGKFIFNGEDFPGTYVANTRSYIPLKIKELKDYPNPYPGSGDYITNQTIGILCIGGYVDK